MYIKKLSNAIAIHPVLFGLYPVLFLMSANLGEIPFHESWRAIFVVIFVSILLWIFLRLILKNTQKAALITTFLIIAFFAYGHLYNFLGQENVLSGALRRHRYTIPLFAGIITLSIWWAVKRSVNFGKTTRVFNLVSLALIVFPAAQIISFEIRSLNESKPIQENNSQPASLGDYKNPDIYYIILDAYGREDILLERFDYDNSAFLDELHDLGFYIAKCSVSNYGKTSMSLTTSLNMAYLENLGGADLQNKATGRVNLVKFNSLITNNEVRRILEANGYTTVAFQTGFAWTEWDDADYFFSYSDEEDRSVLEKIFAPINEFESLLLEISAGILLFDGLGKIDIDYDLDNGSNPKKASDEVRRRIRYDAVKFTLDTLEEIPSSTESPKFVFAHIVSPHRPYVFDPAGNFVPYEQEIDPGYLNQISFINQRVLAIVDSILQNSDPPPIIIIQGDHGAPETDHTPSRLPILNAYYLPGDSNEKLYNSITPVNSFRLIFDQYFDTHYGLLEDMSWNTVDNEPFNFVFVPNTCEGN